jgi:transposase InsO family protein
MHRILAAHDQVRERRAQRRHPEYTKPQLVATAPNQVWSWDTTKLPGPTKGTYFTLYVILASSAATSSDPLALRHFIKTS